MSCSRFSYRLILLPSFAGLICYSCSASSNTVIDSQSIDLSDRSAIESQLEEPMPLASVAQDTVAQDTVAQDVFESTEDRPLNSVSSDAYQEGIDLASGAYALTQSALSPDDWELIVSRWQRAAAALKKVDSKDENYASAQQKIAEYELNAESAKEQLTQLRSPVYVPLPEGHRAASLQVSAAGSSSQSVQVTIVRRLHGTPGVSVTFNGTRPYEMILDTGASRTLITRQMANELGIVPTERMLAATASQAEVSFDIGQAASISMGDVVLRNVPVTIGDAVSLGLLGNDFLRGYDVTIRAQENVVELVRSQ